MRMLMVGTVALLAGIAPALAVHGDHTVEQWHEARYICKMGEDHDGIRVIEPERGAICHALHQLSLVLLKDDYCWSQSEQEWVAVKQEERTCLPSR